MRDSVFKPNIEALQGWVDELQQYAAESPAQLEAKLPKIIEGLQVSLEELGVAEEQPRQQNEELAAVHRAVEEKPQYYKELFDFAPDGYLVTDTDGTIQEANRAAGALLSMAPDSLVGKSVLAFVAEPDRSTFYNQLPQLQTLQGAWEWSVCLQPWEGAPFYGAITVTAARNRQGALVALRWLIRDTSGWVETAEALRESEKKYRLLFEESRDAIYINTREGKIVSVNRATLNLFGYTKAELIGMDIRKLYVHPEDRGKFQQEIERKESVRDYELKLRKNNGTEMDCRVTSTVRRASDGRVLGYQGIIRDITEQVKAERAIRESEQRFHQLAENIREVFWLTSLDGSQVYFISPTYEEIWGRTCESLIAQPESWLDAVHPAHRENAIANFEKQKRGEFVENEYRIVRPDGSIRWIQSHVFPVRNEEGGIYRLAGSAQDITKRKQAEELADAQQQQLIQADKMASLGILVSGVAHEINNPNNFIVINADILSMAWKNIMPILQQYYEENGDFILAGMHYTRAHEKIGQLISGISEGAERIGKIAKTLRDFARQDMGDLNQHVHVNSVVESAIVIVKNLIKKSTDCFSIDAGKSLPTVRGNPQQLEQIVINLITNSCHAIQSRRKSLVVSTSYNKGLDRIIIKVRDEGEGIPPENLHHIIEPFFTTKRHAGGTGLGLAVSYNIVKNHGGDLNFTSKVGQGTTATITLPVSHHLTFETEVNL